jgi:hypothetical protein
MRGLTPDAADRRLACFVRAQMHRIAILAVVVGVLIGVIGGTLGGAIWIGVGAATVTAGVTALWGLAIWKSPREALKVEADVEAMANGYPPRMMDPTAQGEIRSASASTLVVKKGRTNEPAP